MKKPKFPRNPTFKMPKLVLTKPFTPPPPVTPPPPPASPEAAHPWPCSAAKEPRNRWKIVRCMHCRREYPRYNKTHPPPGFCSVNCHDVTIAARDVKAAKGEAV